MRVLWLLRTLRQAPALARSNAPIDTCRLLSSPLRGEAGGWRICPACVGIHQDLHCALRRRVRSLRGVRGLRVRLSLSLAFDRCRHCAFVARTDRPFGFRGLCFGVYVGGICCGVIAGQLEQRVARSSIQCAVRPVLFSRWAFGGDDPRICNRHKLRPWWLGNGW